MSKAEDLAKELYPLLETDKIGNPYIISYNTEQLAKQEGFVEGYHQAEKDLELTWEDISKIISIDQQICGTMGISNYTHNHQQAMKEVLKQFKENRK